MNTAFFLKQFWLYCLVATSCHISGRMPPSDVEPPKVSIVQSDKLGNYFALNKAGLLQKFDLTGKVSYTYNNQTSGRIWSFDAADPMKILVFFRESQELMLLDNTLSELASIHLNQLTGRYFSAVSRTNDGSVALFDVNSEVMLKTNDKLAIEAESFPLYQEGFAGFRPQEMKSNTQNIILNDPEKGLVLMDNFGNFRKFLPVTDAVIVHIDDAAIVYLKKDELVRLDLSFFEEQTIPWPENGSIPSCFGLDQDQVNIFELK